MKTAALLFFILPIVGLIAILVWSLFKPVCPVRLDIHDENLGRDAEPAPVKEFYTMLRARCASHPGQPDHKEFAVTVAVYEEWRVDECGNFLHSEGAIETMYGPDPNNVWNCCECGAEAIVEEVGAQRKASTNIKHDEPHPV